MPPRAREVIDDAGTIYRALDFTLIANIARDHSNSLALENAHVGSRTREGRHFITSFEKPVDEVRSDKTSRARDQHIQLTAVRICASLINCEKIERMRVA